MNFNSLLNESIKIKGNKKNPESVVLFHHADLDGVLTAMLAFRQLVEQGIKPSRIEIKPVQYGSQKPNFFEVKKNQKSVVVDYGNFKDIENEKGYVRPDIISDHHVVPKEELEKFNEAKKLKNQIEPLLKKLTKIKNKTSQDVRKIREYNSALRPAYATMKKISNRGSRAAHERDSDKPEIKGMHKSDTERFATMHSKNLPGKNFLDGISRVDSADIGNIKEFFNAKLTIANLPHIVNGILAALINVDCITGKSNSRTTGVTEYIIRNGKPNFNNLYTLLKNKQSKVGVINKTQQEILTVLKKTDINKRDSKKILHLLPNLSKATQNKLMAGDKTQINKIKTIEGDKREIKDKEGNVIKTEITNSLKQSNKEDYIKAELLAKKGEEIKKYGNEVMVINLKDTTTPVKNRYIYSIIEAKNNRSIPVMIKRSKEFFIQLSVSPLMKKEFIEKIDLLELSKEALEGLKGNKILFNYKKTKSSKEYMDKLIDGVIAKVGGHKGIANIPGISSLGTSRYREQEMYNFTKRTKKGKKYTVNSVYDSKWRVDKLAKKLNADERYPKNGEANRNANIENYAMVKGYENYGSRFKNMDIKNKDLNDMNYKPKINMGLMVQKEFEEKRRDIINVFMNILIEKVSDEIKKVAGGPDEVRNMMQVLVPKRESLSPEKKEEYNKKRKENFKKESNKERAINSRKKKWTKEEVEENRRRKQNKKNRESGKWDGKRV